MDLYNIEFKEIEKPKYVQISDHLKKLIEQGILCDGEKLPTIRSLAKKLAVNSQTVISAYDRLQEEGYVLQRVGSGTYVKKKDNSKSIKKLYSDVFRKLKADALDEYIDFAGETTSSAYFPVELFKEVINNVLDRDGANALVYQDLLGYEGLRESIVKYFWENRISADDVLIVSGAQQGIDIITKALINNNDGIIVEKPTYSGALAVFNWRKCDIYEVEIESDGMNINKLEAILKRNNIKFLYLMSYFQNPTGITYSHEKKKKILQLADIYNFYIIEDDYLAELIYNKDIKYESFKSMDINDRVIYIKSFSKIFLPGIRLGYVITPSEYRDIIQNTKMNTDISTSSLMQRALELYIRMGHWKEHIKFLNTQYSKRYFHLLNRLQMDLSSVVDFYDPGGGLNIYLKIKGDIKLTSIELFNHCRHNKVLITPGGIFYKNHVEGSAYFRIGFSRTDEEEIDRGLDIISKILEENRK